MSTVLSNTSAPDFLIRRPPSYAEQLRRLGDLSGDGTVNLDDFSILASNFGKRSGKADVNADGTVDTRDFNIMRGYFGRQVSDIVKKGLTSKHLGDLSGDKKVNFDDLLSLAQNFNSSTTDADINEDGKVDQSDLCILSGYYNSSVEKLLISPIRPHLLDLSQESDVAELKVERVEEKPRDCQVDDKTERVSRRKSKRS